MEPGPASWLLSGLLWSYLQACRSSPALLTDCTLSLLPNPPSRSGRTAGSPRFKRSGPRSVSGTPAREGGLSLFPRTPSAVSETETCAV